MPLIVVATPLGNLGDITLRSLEALRTADLIVAEDTRVTRKLLNALSIDAKDMWSYREQNAEAVTPGILERAARENVVLVSDAGMPAISDPGSDLVAAAHDAKVRVDVLPGASAALGVAVLSGFSLKRFTFEGFPPRSQGARRKAFAQALGASVTTLWYESPQRIVATLEDLHAVAPDALVFLLREYTKRFEQHARGNPREVLAALDAPVRGEIAFAIAPRQAPAERLDERDVDTRIDELLAEGRPVTEIAKLLAESGAGERRDLYGRITERKRAGGMGNTGRAEKA